jgi:hypothetical protein
MVNELELFAAILTGDIKMAAAALAEGADVNYTPTKDEQRTIFADCKRPKLVDGDPLTPLTLAIALAHENMLQLLLAASESLSPSADEDGEAMYENINEDEDDNAEDGEDDEEEDNDDQRIIPQNIEVNYDDYNPNPDNVITQFSYEELWDLLIDTSCQSENLYYPNLSGFKW